jgi:putative spermidine/putrescine transport system permease protein
MSTTSPRHPFGLFLWLFAAFVFVYLIGPLLVIVASSFGATGYLAFPPRGFSFAAYQQALANPRYLDGFLVSLRIALIVASLSTVVGVLAAYGLTRWRFSGARLIEQMFLSPLVLPGLVLAVAMTIFFSRQKLIVGSDRLILAHLVLGVPCVLRVALPVLQRFDRALEEAAMNLGATPIAAFFLVTLPAIRAGVLAAFALAFIISFDEVEMAVFLASPREAPLTAVLFAQAQYSFEPSLAAVSALLILAVFGFMLAVQFLRILRGAR